MEGAAKFEKKGDEALKTGVLKWSKDYVSAAMNYDQAAQQYRNAALFDKAINVYEKLAEVNDKLNDSWAKARCFESIIDCMFLRDKEAIDIERLFVCCDKSAELFAMSNSLNTLLSVMDKVAKHLEKAGLTGQSIKIYAKMHGYMIKFEEHLFRKDYFTAYLKLLYASSAYLPAIEALKTEIDFLETSEKCKLENLNTHILALLLTYFIVHDDSESPYASNKSFVVSRENDIYLILNEFYQEGNKEEWLKFLGSSKATLVSPPAVP